jgi:ketosteroid isomerase-like protein
MERSPDLRDLTLRLYDALSRGDLASFERAMSRADGTLGIGTDPAEWWSGHDALTRAFRTQLQEVGGAFPIRPGDPQAWQEGTAGWVADRAEFAFPNGPTVPFRLTLVCHREDGDWKVVQWHISTGVTNEEALGKELTV